VTNPKSVVFFIAVLPQFIDAGGGSVPLQLLELGAIFSVLAMLSDSTWAISAGFARDWFGKSPRRMSNLSTAGGVAMIGLGVGLAATGASKD
jgi:threonine/homoserine/homoserine lactone efflux protein